MSNLILTIWQEICKPDYADVQKLKYLDMVINENLRYHVVAEMYVKTLAESYFYELKCNFVKPYLLNASQW